MDLINSVDQLTVDDLNALMVFALLLTLLLAVVATAAYLFGRSNGRLEQRTARRLAALGQKQYDLRDQFTQHIRYVKDMEDHAIADRVRIENIDHVVHQIAEHVRLPIVTEVKSTDDWIVATRRQRLADDDLVANGLTADT